MVASPVEDVLKFIDDCRRYRLKMIKNVIAATLPSNLVGGAVTFSQLIASCYLLIIGPASGK